MVPPPRADGEQVRGWGMMPPQAPQEQMIILVPAGQHQSVEDATVDQRSTGVQQVEVEDAPGNLEEIKWMLEANRPEAAARKLRGHVYTFAHDAVACRVVQEAIERTGSRTAVELAQELKGHILDLAVCPHGNYVVQKVVSHLSVAASHFVLEDGRHAARTAKHRFACRILCRLLELPLSSSVADAESLCCHSFAHHVIQSVLEHGEGRHKERVAKALLSDPFRFSTHKHSSYLIEKALCYCSEDDQQKFLDVLGSPQMILELANTQYGCYVARALLQDDRLNSEKAIRLLKRNRAELEQTKHGYRFLSEMGLTE
eukprot:g23124.t1